MFLLDTNVISEFRKPKPRGAVLAWFYSVSIEQIALSAVTVGELQAGIEKTRRQDAAKALEIEMWLENLPPEIRVIPMDALCFREYARMIAGKSHDLL